ncbi:MAG: nucleotidyltransferase family protein [Rhizomicrobium sp.]
MTAALPDEFRLAAACCIWPPSERRDAAICAAAGGAIKWDRFLDVVERHRIAGLAQDGLARARVPLPEAVGARLAAASRKVAHDSLALAGEALRLNALFDAAAIPGTFLKGTTLAVLAYDNVAIKQAWDIDLLVAPEAVLQASAILRAAGYDRVSPPPDFDDEKFIAWTNVAHESIFRHRERGLVVELHWRLTGNSAISATATTREVVIAAGRTLKTLGDEDLFAYLCLHGTCHAWGRLKWLADLGAWLARMPPGEIERLYAGAKTRGAGRAPAQALLLCNELFALPLPAALSAGIKSNRAARLLANIALTVMQQPEDMLRGNATIEASQFLITGNPREWLRQLNRRGVGWTDLQTFSLPRPLYFLYPLLRGPSWVWRRVLRRA